MTSDPHRFYITTAIPYVNAAPHVGHALEAVQTDAMARYRRSVGDDAYFLTGSDDNSITNVRAAEREGIPVADLVERNTAGFIGIDRLLNIGYDQFIRTSVDERHALGAQKLWRAVQSAGDIYKQEYRGLYCPNCELFYDEDELVDGLCPEHLIRPESVEETNYFFRLSRYQEQLENLIESDTYRVIPAHRKNEVLSFIRSGLRDFSISRSVQRAKGWGVPVPDDDSQVMYVWFDALSNYITALGYAGDDDLYRRYWVDNPNRVHVVGKGIIRFHAVYWPAILLSAGVPPPHLLFVHGYYTVEGRKMSKSLGNVVDPKALVERYGTDASRYYFLAATDPTSDSDFSIDNFEARYNADLANDLGNLLNRTISMVRRYREGVIPRVTLQSDADVALVSAGCRIGGTVEEAMSRFDFQSAVASIWSVVGDANRYIEVQAPWRLAKEERQPEGAGPAARERLDSVLYSLSEAIRLIAANLEAFLPETAGAIRQQLGIDNRSDIAGCTVQEPVPLFPRLDLVKDQHGSN